MLASFAHLFINGSGIQTLKDSYALSVLAISQRRSFPKGTAAPMYPRVQTVTWTCLWHCPSPYSFEETPRTCSTTSRVISSEVCSEKKRRFHMLDAILFFFSLKRSAFRQKQREIINILRFKDVSFNYIE